jgi:hypothetical protein
MDKFVESLYNVLSTNIGLLLLVVIGIALAISNTKKYVINRNETISAEIAAEKKYPILRLLNILWLIALLVGAPYFLTAFSMHSNKAWLVPQVCTHTLPRFGECVTLSSQQCPDFVTKQITNCYESLPNNQLFATYDDKFKLNHARRMCISSSIIKELTEKYSTNTPQCQQLIETRVREFMN